VLAVDIALEGGIYQLVAKVDLLFSEPQPFGVRGVVELILQ